MPPTSRFSRRPGAIVGEVPGADDLRLALGARHLDACRDIFLRDRIPGGHERGLWGRVLTVTIQPSFHAWAQVGLIRALDNDGVHVMSRVAMVVGGCPEASCFLDDLHVPEPALEWPAPWPGERLPLQLDGCRYSVGFSTGVRTSVDFAPVTPEWGAWEQGFFRLAQHLTNRTENALLAEYLEVWRQYLRPPVNTAASPGR